MDPRFDIAADLDTPVSAFRKLAPLEPRFLLESVEGGERLARYSFLGLGEAMRLRIEDGRLERDGRSLPPPGGRARNAAPRRLAGGSQLGARPPRAPRRRC